jgi:hypothetical protein
VREATILAHVLRCFHDPDVIHVHGDVDPVRDFGIVETELLLADLERLDRWLSKERVHARSLKKGERHDLVFLQGLRDRIAAGEHVRGRDVPAPETALFEELQLLTSKPEICVLNADEEGTNSGICAEATQRLGAERTIVLSAKIERELAELNQEEREEFRRELGIAQDARTRFIGKCHELLGMIRYYTAANRKLQAWSVPAGTKAPVAAGKIHTDMEAGFIRAKVVRFEDLVRCGSEAEAQHHGLLRTEGHEYEIRDGDVVEYLFSR